MKAMVAPIAQGSQNQISASWFSQLTA